MPTMRRNAALNAAIAPGVRAAELNWCARARLLLPRVYLRTTLHPHHRGAPLPPALAHRTFDLVLAADCVYFEPAFPLLVHTLCALLPPGTGAGERTEALFCYKKRRKVRFCLS
jgi:hypothetical protein